MPQNITLKLFISTILFLCFSCGSISAQVKPDSAVVNTENTIEQEDTTKHFQYYRVGLDVSKIVRSVFTDEYSAYEFLFESVWKKNMHYLIETGFATSNTSNDNISFKASSTFIRLGFDKYFFGSLYEGDMDNAFVGLRLGGAYNKRQEATATLWDPYYGNTLLTKPASSQLVYWIELTAGIRIELAKNIFAGWNVRGKTFINPKKIEELSPNYLAGYGPAKNKPAFDYNLFLLYGFGKR